MIKPILQYNFEVFEVQYNFEVSVHENIERIEVFHHIVLRWLLRVRKRAMTYRDLGRQELKDTIW